MSPMHITLKAGVSPSSLDVFHVCHCSVLVRTIFSHVMNLLLIKLAQDHIGRISAHRPCCAQSVLSRPQANILPELPSHLVNSWVESNLIRQNLCEVSLGFW